MKEDEYELRKVSTSEGKWVQVKEGEYELRKVSTCEGKWAQVKESEYKWRTVSTSEGRWVRVKDSEYMWRTVSTSDDKCVLVEVSVVITWCIYTYSMFIIIVPYMWASMTFLPRKLYRFSSLQRFRLGSIGYVGIMKGWFYWSNAVTWSVTWKIRMEQFVCIPLWYL